MKKGQKPKYKPAYRGLSMLELVFCEFWFDYVKPKYGEK